MCHCLIVSAKPCEKFGFGALASRYADQVQPGFTDQYTYAQRRLSICRREGMPDVLASDNG